MIRYDLRKRSILSIICLFLLLLLIFSILGCGYNNDYAEQIKAGRYKGIELGADDATSIIAKIGNPSEQKTLPNGTIQLVYSDITYAINGDTKKLGAIVSHSKTQKLFGVNIGMSFDEAKAILGKPTYDATGVANTRDENRWIIDYNHFGENTLVLGGPSKEGPVTMIMFLHVPKKD